MRRRGKWRPWELDAMRYLLPRHGLAEAARIFSAMFPARPIGASALKSLQTKHRMKGPGRGSNKLLTPAQERWLRRNYGGETRDATRKKLNVRFGLALSFRQFGSLCARLALSGALNSGRFQKGASPPNKGRKGQYAPGSEKGWFRKGHGGTPGRTRDLLAERVDRVRSGAGGTTPVIMLKVPGPAPYPSMVRANMHQKARWVRKAVWVWTRHHGRDVPPGHAIAQLDGDYRNCDADNLECVPRGVLAVMNKNFPATGDPATDRARFRAAQLMYSIGRRRAAKESA